MPSPPPLIAVDTLSINAGSTYTMVRSGAVRARVSGRHSFGGRTGLHPAGTSGGMTMVEILAVVVILGLVATVLLAGFSGSFGKAKRELARSGIGVVVGKLELYKIEHDTWPSNDVGLAALSDGHAQPTASYYVNPDQLLDPWGNPYLFVRPGPDGHPYEIISYGADGQPGGAGEHADISSVNLRDSEVSK